MHPLTKDFMRKPICTEQRQASDWNVNKILQGLFVTDNVSNMVHIVGAMLGGLLGYSNIDVLGIRCNRRKVCMMKEEF